MTLELRETVAEALRSAVRVGDARGGATMERALRGLHPVDVAEALRALETAECVAVFNYLDNDRAAVLLGELDSELVRMITDNLPRARVADLLSRLPMDDAADVLAESDPDRAEEMLDDLERQAPSEAADVRELLSYDEDSAGRLMTDKLVRVLPTHSVARALEAVRSAGKEVETLTDVYVVEDVRRDGTLLGVLSLRDLITARPEQRVRDIMVKDPITCSVDDSQSDVARVISKYDLHALPVLDRNYDFVGIVTVDDVIDVLVEEFNEDYLRLVGSDAEEMDRRNPIQVAQLRLPWLMGTMVLELIAGAVISHYSRVLTLVPLLASFMPVISAISGNVGLQAAAIVVRGLDTGHVTMDNWVKAVSKEMMTSLLMAVACGLTLGIVGVVWSHRAPFGLVIGVAMTCSMLTAGILGTIIPMISKRLGFDPAASAGPFETAFQDIIGFGVFLWLASMLVNWLR